MKVVDNQAPRVLKINWLIGIARLSFSTIEWNMIYNYLGDDIGQHYKEVRQVSM